MIAYLIPIILSVIAGLTGFGIVANWWFNFADWNFGITAIIALAACILAAYAGSWWMRFVITVALALVMYIHGALDRQAQLTVKFKADIDAIHKRYADVSTAERKRQLEANEKAKHEAAAEKEKQDAELVSLRDQLTALHEKAATDPHAKERALNVDAVRRINAFRLHAIPIQ